jgi:hypothetical protein
LHTYAFGRRDRRAKRISEIILPVFNRFGRLGKLPRPPALSPENGVRSMRPSRRACPHSFFLFLRARRNGPAVAKKRGPDVVAVGVGDRCRAQLHEDFMPSFHNRGTELGPARSCRSWGSDAVTRGGTPIFGLNRLAEPRRVGRLYRPYSSSFGFFQMRNEQSLHTSCPG